MELGPMDNQTNNFAIEIYGLGKMYRLYHKPVDKILDAFGLNRYLFWRKDYYREFWALRDLNLRVRRGERLGIIGRNGAGKSTLLKIITGNIGASEGKVTANGQIQALMELGTGFHPEFTGRENIRASLAYQGFTAVEVRNMEEEIIDFAEIGQFIDQPIRTYSAGMYARLAFAAATVVKPDILIIDEVLGAGDAYFAGKCVDRMRALTEESGATVLFVSHDLGSVQQMCEHVIWIDRGKVVKTGDPQEVTKAYYAAVMQDEELRLRARNAKLQRYPSTRNSVKEAKQEVQEVLCRLVVGNDGAPSKRHPIRRLSLADGGNLNFTVAVGAPMDNDSAQDAYLLFDKRYMNWSKPQVEHGVRVRCFEDLGGKYGHAPFVFAVPTSIWESSSFSLEIEHAARDGEDVIVELLDGVQYRRLGKLTPSETGWRVDSFIIRNGAVKKDIAIEEKHEAARDRWDTRQARFLDVLVVDENEQTCEIVKSGSPFKIKIRVKVMERLEKSHIVIVLYDSKGNLLVHYHDDIHGAFDKGLYEIVLTADRNDLRQGEYVISCELLPLYDPMATTKLPYYCHWNRCIAFKVDEGYTGHIPLGVVAFPFRTTSRKLNVN